MRLVCVCVHYLFFSVLLFFFFFSSFSLFFSFPFIVFPFLHSLFFFLFFPQSAFLFTLPTIPLSSPSFLHLPSSHSPAFHTNWRNLIIPSHRTMDIDAPSSSTTGTDMTSQTTTTSPKQKKPYTKSSSSTKSSTTHSKPNPRGVRITFELDDVLRKYTPEEFKTCKGYDVGGVNILNKKPLDSKTALDKITRRRETHNRVERRRRDCINQLIDELTDLLPKEDDDSLSKGHRVNILRNVVSHIQTLTLHNETLNRQLQALQTGTSLPPPTIITTPAPPAIHFGTNDNHVSDTCSTSSPSFTSYDSRSHPSPQSAEHFSPTSSPRFNPSYQHPEPQHYFTPLQPPGPESLGTNESSRAPSPSPLPSLNDMAVTLPAIPQIVEPLDGPDQYDSSSGSYSKRMNRQTLPRLQLLPPPFEHHGRSNSTSSHLGSPSSPSYHGQPSPTSAYSGYSSTSGPWSSTSSSFGPFSTHSPSGSIPYSPNGPTSPYSPFGPSSATLSTSPSGFSHSRSPLHSPRLNPWDKPSTHGHVHAHAAGGIEEQSLPEANGWCSTSHLQQHAHPYKSDWRPEVS
ncbi:MAG: hypothetical protein J3R72DRAFT_235228 [Linnemannia gamsii]|nr:MAG: hypothetical protein J3R72DRAFT_235228 [Linnemannia gamsii]